MEEDVYKTPQSDLINYEKGSAIKAIIVATLVDITATIFVGVAISIVYGVILASNGDSLEVVTSKLSNMGLTSRVSLLALMSGFLVTVFAGYLCAKLVNHSEYTIVAIFAAIVIVFGWVMGFSYYSVNENVLLSLLNLCAAYFGAWVYVSQKKQKHQS